MTLRKCDKCNLETVDTKCLQCGSRTKKPHPILKAFLLALIAIIAIYTLYDYSSAEKKPPTKQSQQAQPATQSMPIEPPIVKAKDLSQYFREVQNIKSRITGYQEYMQTHYADNTMLRQMAIDLSALKEILLTVKPVTIEHHRLLAITKSYKKDATILLRDVYAQLFNLKIKDKKRTIEKWESTEAIFPFRSILNRIETLCWI